MNDSNDVGNRKTLIAKDSGRLEVANRAIEQMNTLLRLHDSNKQVMQKHLEIMQFIANSIEAKYASPEFSDGYQNPQTSKATDN